MVAHRRANACWPGPTRATARRSTSSRHTRSRSSSGSATTRACGTPSSAPIRDIIYNQAKKTDGTPASGGPSLSNVDGIFFLGHREVPFNDQQKKELLEWVRSGKGFVAAHTGLTALESWPEFGEMLGATYGGHLYTGPGQMISEQPTHPIVKHWGATSSYNDEFYQADKFSRDKIDVLLRFNPTSAPPTANLAADGDFPLVWTKMYGQGRVVYSSLSHSTEAWDLRSLQIMMSEAMKWSLGLTEAPVQPHAKPDAPAAAAPVGGRGRGGRNRGLTVDSPPSCL